MIGLGTSSGRGSGSNEAPMKIVACVKQTLDTTVPLRVVDGVVRQDAPWPIMSIGLADRAGLEEALRLRNRLGGSVAAVSAGEEAAIAALQFSLARGADRAIHVLCKDPLDPVGTAIEVATALASEHVDLVLAGVRSGDGASGSFPPTLAARLGWPLVTGVVGIALEQDHRIKAERRVERGDREIVLCPLPAVLAVEAALAEPRYVSVRARRSAASLPVEKRRCDAGCARGASQLIGLEMAKPRPRRVSAPDAKLPVMDRLAHLLTGGMQQKKQQHGAAFVEGSPGTVAAEIVRFLEERGFVRTRKGPTNA